MRVIVIFDRVFTSFVLRARRIVVDLDVDIRRNILKASEYRLMLSNSTTNKTTNIRDI